MNSKLLLTGLNKKAGIRALMMRTLFYQADPNGFLVGMLDDEPIATGSAVIYDKQFAFCGLYIVKPAYRRQGLGFN